MGVVAVMMTNKIIVKTPDDVEYQCLPVKARALKASLQPQRVSFALSAGTYIGAGRYISGGI